MGGGRLGRTRGKGGVFPLIVWMPGRELTFRLNLIEFRITLYRRRGGRYLP